MSEKRKNAENRLKILITDNPSLSTRKAASAIGISHETVRIIFKDDLHLKPYKIQECHELEPADLEKRLFFVHWFLRLPNETSRLFICSDEAYFTLTESLNKQNNRLWLESRPIDKIERPLYDEKVLVWCAISASKIYGPFYFEETVNQHNYLKMLQTFFLPKHLRTISYKQYYFEQDGATPHTSNIVQDWLRSKFSDRFIDKTQWPPRSPDLNPCDFYLWGHLKALVYNPLPKTINQLKANIEREIKKINREILESTFTNFKKRLNLLIEAKSGHFEEK